MKTLVIVRSKSKSPNVVNASVIRQPVFRLVSPYQPAGDQEQAIAKLIANIKNNHQHNVLLGATGTGKTFTVANVIANLNRQTLVIAHNKTLAMQLYVELKNLFPSNRVEFFVSNFDYYQPEAYLPSRDLYINKDVKHNLELDMMRLSACNALLTRHDTIVVASVACIFAAPDPKSYQQAFFELKVNSVIKRRKLITFLINSGYTRVRQDLAAGVFTVQGDVIKIAPGHRDDYYIRLDTWADNLEEIALVDSINHHVKQRLTQITIFPAQNYVTEHSRLKIAVKRIKAELNEQVNYFLKANKRLEANRLRQRTNYDLELLQEFGTCAGIENYSMHLDLRDEAAAPYTLLDYFEPNFLTIIDESHMTVPQIHGMFNTNVSRKQSLIKYGFRLPSALQNRPLNFAEFKNRLNTIIFTSATPGNYELELTHHHPVEQIIRPTGLLDPQVSWKQPENQMHIIIEGVHDRIKKQEKVLVTTVTKRMSEDVAAYLQKMNIKAVYLHSELKTIERTNIINDLRRGVYDCLVGVNLLREGIDIPEISLICILDADKTGFLRDTRSLIQIIGRAARNVRGQVYLFGYELTASMKQAMAETNRRRGIQAQFNQTHHITPKTITKKVAMPTYSARIKTALTNIKRMRKRDQKLATAALITRLEHDMHKAATEYNFEKAAHLRDTIITLKVQQ